MQMTLHCPVSPRLPAALAHMPMHAAITCRQADGLWVQRCSSYLTGTAACALEEKLKGQVPQLALCRSNCEQHDCRKLCSAEQLRRSWQAVGSAMAQPGAARQSHLPSAGHDRVEGPAGRDGSVR